MISKTKEVKSTNRIDLPNESTNKEKNDIKNFELDFSYYKDSRMKVIRTIKLD